MSGFEREECIGKFYRISISTENPQFSEIHLNEEIIDTNKILSSGFTLIKNKKSYYDPFSAEYKFKEEIIIK